MKREQEVRGVEEADCGDGPNGGGKRRDPWSVMSTLVSLIDPRARPGHEQYSRTVVGRAEATPESLLDIARRPWAPGLYRNGWVSHGTLESASVVGLDIDEGATWAEAVARLRAEGLAFSAYTTRSHSRPKVTRGGVARPACDRFRVVLWLSAPCTSPEAYRATLLGHAAQLKLPVDQGAVDAARYFYPRPADGLTAWADGRHLEPLAPQPRATTIHLPPLVSEPEPPWWPPIEIRLLRAKAYLAMVPPAIEGSGGNLATVKAIRICWDFGLSDPNVAMEALADWNARCDPPWEGGEWSGKICSALKGKGRLGSKLNEPRPGRLLEVYGAAGVQR